MLEIPKTYREISKNVVLLNEAGLDLGETNVKQLKSTTVNPFIPADQYRYLYKQCRYRCDGCNESSHLDLHCLLICY